ncbi:MAG: LamG-like jellyroll fold domain-containing protein [Calditrichota bacterium]
MSIWTTLLAVPGAGATSSLNLTGINSYATTPDATTFDFTGSFTIELRFRSNGPHDGVLVSKFWQSSGTPLDDSYILSVLSTDTLQARIQTTLQLVDLRAGGPIHDGEWHHVAFVFDTTNHITELYLDGELEASQSLFGLLRNTVEPLRLGAVLAGGGGGSLTLFFNGQMDELRFWNVARRGEQAWCLKDVTLLEQTPGLVSYYRFDEETGNTSFDLIEPDENFTLLSGATFSASEPPFGSRLSGSGQCLCGTVSGIWSAATPTVTLVGDTIRVGAGDSLILNSHTLTIDSTVAQVLVAGKLRATGTIADSSRILGQGTPVADAEIILSGTQPTGFIYTRISGFASNALHISPNVDIEHCLISNNTGCPVTTSATVNILDSRFIGNGTGLHAISGNVNIEQSHFENNGGGIQIENSNLTVDSTDFTGNYRSGAGAAINLALNSATRAEITNGLFSANIAAARNGGAISASGDLSLSGSGDSLIIRDCVFQDNAADSGGGVWVKNVNLRMDGCDFESNTATQAGGGLTAIASFGGLCRVRGDSLTFNGNQGGVASALLLKGIAGNAPVETRIHNSIFANNTHAEASDAPAVRAQAARQISGAGPLFERCLFHDNDNSGGTAGAIAVENAYSTSSAELRNLTVVLNQADSAAVQLSAPAMLRNSIVIENGGTKEITGTNPAVAYCLTSDTQYHGVGGSYYADPAFADFWERDFHLTAGSYAINRGDPNLLYNDPNGTRADVGAFVADDFLATIESLNDVPHDNGRHLMLQWLPSVGDDSRQGITSYNVYRQVNLAVLENYELVAAVPAAQLEGYGRIVPTLADSNAAGIPYYSYFVRAQSVNPLAFWDTPLDSGYSVDNLAPSVPQQLAGIEIPVGAELTWAAVSDSDLAFYAIYRASAPFDPDTTTQVFATCYQPTYVDSTEAGSYYYAIRAVDINGNYSEPSNTTAVDVGTVSPPLELTIALENDSLRLRWLPSPGATEYWIFYRYHVDGYEDFVAATSDTTYLVTLTGSRGFFYIVARR